MYTSIGKLRYTNDQVILLVDRSLVRYLRSLIPKYVEHRAQANKPHITVVRGSGIELPDLTQWGLHEGEIVEFEYWPLIQFDDRYYSISVQSKGLEEIREELGLPKHRVGFNDFHITIARAFFENEYGN